MRDLIVGLFMAAEYMLGSLVGAEMCPDGVSIVVHIVLVFAACMLTKGDE